MASRPFSTSLKAIKKNCSISSIEEKARALLSRNHLLNLIHNISEYGAKRNMDIETFVTILLELLDTPEKVSTNERTSKVVSCCHLDRLMNYFIISSLLGYFLITFSLFYNLHV